MLKRLDGKFLWPQSDFFLLRDVAQLTWFSGTTAYVLALNSTIRLSPDTLGEFYLARLQLADGYLNLPEQTREVFITNPFGPRKLYRTGNMVVARADRVIEIIGRIDQQTKIDGHRIESNEYNSIITSCQGVIASSVVSTTTLNRKALIATIIPEKDDQWTSLIRELRYKLRADLPSYSIPAYWVQRNELPLYFSGNTDIACLVRELEAMGKEILISR